MAGQRKAPSHVWSQRGFFSYEGMHMHRFALAGVAAALVLIGSGKSRADDTDTLRLGGTGDAKVQSLVYDGDADTEEVYLRRWGGGWGGGWGFRPRIGIGVGFHRPFLFRPFARRAYYGY